MLKNHLVSSKQKNDQKTGYLLARSLNNVQEPILYVVNICIAPKILSEVIPLSSYIFNVYSERSRFWYQFPEAIRCLSARNSTPVALSSHLSMASKRPN